MSVVYMPGLNCYAAQIITYILLKIVVYGKKVKQHILRPYIHKQRLPLLHNQIIYIPQDYTTIQWMQVYVQNRSLEVFTPLQFSAYSTSTQ